MRKQAIALLAAGFVGFAGPSGAQEAETPQDDVKQRFTTAVQDMRDHIRAEVVGIAENGLAGNGDTTEDLTTADHCIYDSFIEAEIQARLSAALQEAATGRGLNPLQERIYGQARLENYAGIVGSCAGRFAMEDFNIFRDTVRHFSSHSDNGGADRTPEYYINDRNGRPALTF